MATELVTDPRRFMREQTKYRGVRTQIYLLFVVGIAFALQHVGSYYQLGDVGIDVYEAIIIHVGVVLVVPFLVWIASSFLIAILARFVAGRILIGDIFRLSGWALFPVLFAGLVQTAGRLYALRGAEPPDLGMNSHLSVKWEEYRAYLESANADPVFLLSTAIAAALVVYSGYLVATALEEIGEADGIHVSRSAAAILSVVPVALCLLWVGLPFVW